MSYVEYAHKLQNGETVSFRPRGNSMKPKINSGELVTVKPCDINEIKKDDIVFCKVNGNYYIHLVTAVKGNRLQISNNHGHINGWCGLNSFFGKVVKVEK